MDSNKNDQYDNVLSLLFRVASRPYALPVACVVETMRPLPIEPFTNAPIAVKGLAVIRGTPIPVIELATLLDSESEPPTRFVTVKIGNNQVALAVDSVIGLRKLPVSTFKDTPLLLSGANSNAVSAIGILNAELLLILNTAHLVPESVWQAINDHDKSS